MLDVLGTAQHLKRLSRKARDEERFDEADALLTQAIEKLESEFARLQKRPSDEREKKLPASQEVRRVAAELADCLGSLGGVRRRQGRITEALELYSRGKDLEQDDRYRIANSYNQVQWLVSENPQRSGSAQKRENGVGNRSRDRNSIQADCDHAQRRPLGAFGSRITESACG